MKTSVYDESAIRHLSNCDAVQAKPQMYIGATDDHGLLTLVREAADNVVDEALSGHASYCGIFVDEDADKQRVYTVIDDGRGMPVGTLTLKDSVSGTPVKMPAIQAITSLLHAGGKLNASDAYKVSIGSHGVGVKCTNFLSEWFEVCTFNKGKWWKIGYTSGRLSTELVQMKAPPKHPISKKSLEKGTVINFKPDLKFFTAKKFAMSLLVEWALMKAYFTPGFKVDLAYKGDVRTYDFPEGVSAYLADRLATLEAVPLEEDSTFMYTGPLVDCVFVFSSNDGTDFGSYTNGLMNGERGNHYDTFFRCLMRALEPYIPKTKDGKSPFTVVEVREGLVGLVNCKLSSPMFASQTKERLVDPRAGQPLQESLLPELITWAKQNKSVVSKVIQRATALKALKAKFVASKEAISKLKAASKKGFKPTAAVAPDCVPDKRELFLIEGDSAGGSARAARDSSYQEILPLRGKVLNVGRNVPDSRVFENEEVLAIMAQLGFDPKLPDPLDKLRVGKVVTLADPDPDGPLVGSTLVPIRVGGAWMIEKISRLVDYPVPYRVLSVDPRTGRFVAAPALCREVLQAKESIRLTFEGGKSETCTLSHKWPVEDNAANRYRGEIDPVSKMRMVPASEFKSGMRVLHFGDLVSHETATKGIGREVFSTRGVSKVRRLEHSPEPFFCLTVPDHGNFVLASGLVSSNCHINALLLTLLFRFLPGLFERGMVFAASVPEYYALGADGRMWTAATGDELRDILKANRVKADVQHIKGYGEVSPEVLKALAFDPATRSLKRITPVVGDDGDLRFWGLVGNDSSSRKTLLGIS